MATLAMDEGMARIFRRPNDQLAFDRKSVRTIDADGRLHVSVANISKACVNPYIGREIPGWKELGLDSSKIYYLLRDPKELEKGAATFNNLPLLDEHKPVTADDHDKERTVGSTGTDAVFNYPYLQNSLVVWTREAIQGVTSKKQRQLSSAYRYKPDMTPGVWEPTGERYDGVMRDIIGNHVCLVEEGRAGADVVVGDSAEELAKMAKASKKATATRLGLMASATIAYTALPYTLAQDAKPLTAMDIMPCFNGVTAKNWKDKKPEVAKKLAALLKPRYSNYAQDEGATPDDVTLKLLDMLDGGQPDAMGESIDESVSEPQHNAMEAAAEGHSNLGIPQETGKEFVKKDAAKDEGGVEAEILKFLSDKLTPEDLELIKGMLAKEDEAEEAAGGEGEGDPVVNENPDEEKAQDEPPPFKGRPNPGGAMDNEEKEKDMVTKTAMDAAIEDAVKKERVRQGKIREAFDAVAPYVGRLQIAADSADDVYGAALKSLGEDIKDIPPAAFPHILKHYPRLDARRTGTRQIAQDKAEGATKSYGEMFPQAGRITRVG